LLDIEYPLQWKQGVIDKISWKHNVNPEEVEEVVFGGQLTCVKSGQDRYCLFGQSISGRYLFVVLGRTNRKRIFKVITARQMTSGEKRNYRKRHIFKV
jgi:uncharacterized DUF497 family protein